MSRDVRVRAPVAGVRGCDARPRRHGRLRETGCSLYLTVARGFGFRMRLLVSSLHERSFWLKNLFVSHYNRESRSRSSQDAWALGLVLWGMMSRDADAVPFPGGGEPSRYTDARCARARAS